MSPKRSTFIFIILICFGLAGTVWADRGQVWPYPVQIAEDSQKAIILHNKEEEILILGTELRADREVGILEFIPFPSEPKVSLVKGDPFAVVRRLLSQKQLEFVEMSKGGSKSVPVELKFQAQLGLHEVTVIKINDLAGFSEWVTRFFKQKKINIKNNFSNVYNNAEDYLKRGYSYFVFDYVLLAKNGQFVEPLLYKFKSEKLYYPLKTSNIIGGTGLVDLVLFLPGSIGLLEDRSDLRKLSEAFNGNQWDLSSSAKVYPEEIKDIYPEAGAFFKGGKIYLQTVEYYGNYQFKDDLALDLSKLAPYAFKHLIYLPDYHNYALGGNYKLVGALSPDEKQDIADAYAQKRPEWVFTPEILEAIRDLPNLQGGSSK